MKRREFLKKSMGLAAAAAIPSAMLKADVIPDDGSRPLPLEAVRFDPEIYRANEARTILIFLGGGMSDIVANMTHLSEIVENDLSQTPYPQGRLTPTDGNGFWLEAGGDILERCLDEGELTVFRTCYSHLASASHGLNQKRYCHGNDRGYESGIPMTLMHLLHRGGVVGESDMFVNVAIDGGFYKLLQDFSAAFPLPPYLRPISFNRDFDNPYEYGRDDRNQVDLGDYKTNEIFNAADFDRRLDTLMRRHNRNDPLAEIFNGRKELSEFVEEAKNRQLPVEYPKTVDGRKLETAMRILTGNPSTRFVTILGGHSGWDDHSDAITLHEKRARELFEAVEVAMRHMRAEKIDNINIVLFGDFGRNLSLNSTGGWDHGNNQALLWFGGTRYLRHMKVVGETELEVRIPKARLYHRPAAGTFEFSPISIAATIYRLYGVVNPEVLTGGYGIIDPSRRWGDGSAFLKS